MTEELIRLYAQDCEISEVMLKTLSSQHFADICETAALAANLAKHNAAHWLIAPGRALNGVRT